MNKLLERFKINKRGYTMAELVIVMVILIILFAGMIPIYNIHVKNSRIDTVEGNLVIFKSDIEAYLEDYGVFTIPAGASQTERAAGIKEFLNKLSTDYLHMTFDSDSLVFNGTSFYVDTQTKDPWTNPYRMYYNFDPTSATVGTTILASAGPNLGSNAEFYGVGEFDDDILVTIVPKIGVVAGT